MSNEFDKYLAAASNFGLMRKRRDFVAGNRFADELQELGTRMRVVPDGQAELLEMLVNEDPYVRIWAAKDCLFFSQEQAVPVLESLAQLSGMISVSAKTTLDEWRAGRLK